MEAKHSNTVIVRADLTHLEDLSRLFDQYRQFYKQASDIAASRLFIADRIRNEDAVIFLALDETGRGLGFVQLYHSFESVTMTHLWILYDLFVTPAARTRKLGRALMERATLHAQQTGASRLILETAHDNVIGQQLYESLGYKRDDVFYRYYLMV